MRRKLITFLTVVLIATTFINIIPVITVYATETDDEDDDEDEDDSSSSKPNSSGSSLSGDFTEADKQAMMSDMGISEDQFTVLVTVYAATASQYGEICASAICGNVYRECKFDPTTIEGGTGNGVGITQSSFARRVKFSEFCKQNSTNPLTNITAAVKSGSDGGYITSSAYITCVGDLHTQAAFLFAELTKGSTLKIKDSAIESSALVGDSVSLYDGWEGASRTPSVYGYSQYSDTPTFDIWLMSTDVAAATVNFCSHFERCAYDERSGMSERIKYAELTYKHFKGKSVGSYVSTASATSLSTIMVNNGLWDEDQLSAFCRLAEIEINDVLKNARRDRLNQSELNALKSWEDNTGRGKETEQFIRYGRIGITFLAIIFMVWMLFLYASYWFDRVNNFIDVNLLGIFSFGKLRVAPVEEESTFSLRKQSDASIRTVNHRDMLFILIVGISFGALIATGQLFVLILKLVRFVTGLRG